MYTLNDVAKHNKPDDCWIVIDDIVYDVTKFVTFHPGGKRILYANAGVDVSEQFHIYHDASVLKKYESKLQVGKLITNSNDRSKKKKDGDTDEFGDMIPYSDPYWYQGYSSPYYNDTHRAFRARVRAFVEREMRPYVSAWDESGTYPPELHKKAYEAGLYAACWPKEYGGTPPNGFDMFHDMILVDELARCGAGGVLWAVFWSFGIALPPVLKYGSDYLKEKVVQKVLRGEAIMSLAVTEPYGGSDVAGLRTTAVKSRCGKYYMVNGEKKFITSGNKATFFTVAVRTGGTGMRGISVLLMERGMAGFTVRRQKTQGWLASNTAFLVFDNVQVPVENLIGKENEGFKYIMVNFNHERFVLAASANRYARVCLEDAINYARKRKTFGKRLIDHQVIRHKMVEMIRRIESTHSLLEQIAYQMKVGVSDRKMGGFVALAKVQATKTMDYCAREASQVLGGASFIRGSGAGARIERLYREVRVNAIGGGSEEILMDLVGRQAKL